MRRLAVVACMDARLDPARNLGLLPGDIHCIRNAGGIATDDALRSLVISQRHAGTNQVTVMMHTDCAMLGFDDDAESEAVYAETGTRPSFTFGGFADLEERLQRSVDAIRRSPLLLHRDRVRGVVYDVDTGKVRTVVGL